MSSDNKALVRRWFDEVWNNGRVDSIDDIMGAKCVVHGLGPAALDGPAGFKPFHASYRDAFPDVKLTVDDIVGEGSIVAARWSGTGTHRGNGLGLPATGRPVTFTGMTFARVENGKIVEGWNVFDQLNMFQQLGVVTLPI